MFKNDIKIDFEFVNLNAFNEIFSLNLKKSKKIFIFT